MMGEPMHIVPNDAKITSPELRAKVDRQPLPPSEAPDALSRDFHHKHGERLILKGIDPSGKEHHESPNRARRTRFEH